MTYAGIERAALEISYDNGGINRFRTEADLRGELDAYLATSGQTFDLAAIDAWLLALSEDEIEIVCAGEQTEALALLASRHAPAGTDELLNNIFEQVG
jgi:hypothetical protein